jgi:diamine N-acetyltransferase
MSEPRVTLVEITAETVRAVCDLAVADDQRCFVATNAQSMSEAHFAPEAWFRAIHADDELVGFVMLYDETLREEVPAEPTAFIWRFMIDVRFQRRGFGREALSALAEHVRSRGYAKLELSYVPGPGDPEPFYLGAGFVHTGREVDDELVLERSLKP